MAKKQAIKKRYSVYYGHDPREEDVLAYSTNNLQTSLKKAEAYGACYPIAYVYDELELKTVSEDY